MKWFRLYSEARNDAKLRHLDDREHRIWFNLLCFASEQEERGVIPVKNNYLLAVEVSNGDAEALERTIEKLTMLDILQKTSDSLVFTHFAARQYEKPSDSPDKVRERVARHRAKKKQAEKQEGNTDVTPSNAIDTEADTETDSKTEKEINNHLLPIEAAEEKSEYEEMLEILEEKKKRSPNAFALYENTICIQPSEPEKADLARWITSLGDDFVYKAIEECCKASDGPPNFKFLRFLIRDWTKKGAKTPADIDRLQEAFWEKREAQNNLRVIKGGNRNNQRQDIVPPLIQEQLERQKAAGEARQPVVQAPNPDYEQKQQRVQALLKAMGESKHE